MKRFTFLLAFFLLTVACQPTETTVSLLQPQEEAVTGIGIPTLEDFWLGSAEFILEVENTGLPMGESETISVASADGHLWSYVHASDRSAGVTDQCGAPVEFPGCVVIYRSFDGGMSFAPEDPPICQIACQQCPCTNERDHIAQQQYPRVQYHEPSDTMMMVYENGGATQMRLSRDGLAWGYPFEVGGTGHWVPGATDCEWYNTIGQHPFVPYDWECLSGAPPGLFIEGDTAYVFAAGGQAPGRMTCYKGRVGQNAQDYQPCDSNPLFTGAAEYGPIELRGRDANQWWDFRTISSAEVIAVGEGEARRYFMVYEGLRGPGPGDPGDTQFGLGLARSVTNQIDGPWVTFPGNPILVDSPANIGIGHADLVIINGETILYTSLDGVVRSRLRLVWKQSPQ